MPRVVTRFAPSPTGPLHLGHAFSALTAFDLAQAAGGDFVLRIEDIDALRCRPAFEAAILEDLAWLGLVWPEPVLRQSERLHRYAAALARLGDLGLTYPCRCSRADIRAAHSAPQEGAAPRPAVYPGVCRGRPISDLRPGDAVRLDLARALDLAGAGLRLQEIGPLYYGEHGINPDEMHARLGDVVLGRKDIGAAYHLAVVVDDAAQGVTQVVRGVDLWEVTPLHRLLQALLGLPAPVYHHHRLIRDAEGRRLAKRDDARAIARFRADGLSAAAVRALVGL